MKVEVLKSERIREFIDYCKEHRSEVSDGCLQDTDLEEFKLNEKNPTYILVDDKNKIVGTVSLIIDDYYRAGKRGYIRIFHSVIHEKEAYELMFNSIKQHTEGLEKLIFFIKEDDIKTTKIIENMGFKLDGYGFSMIREDIDVNEPYFPEGFELRSFKPGRDEEDWCEIRNISFSDEGPMSPDRVHIYLDDSGHIDGGMMILYHKGKPVGTIRVSKEYEDNVPYAYISVVCVRPEYRGMGLARNLLRAAISFGKSKGLPRASLEVDVANKNALGLYTNEGFEKLYGQAFYLYYIK